MRLVLALASLTGCSSILGIEDFKLVDAGPTPDIAPDVAGNAVCIGPAGFEVCLPDNVGPKVLFAAINTTSSPLCAPQPPTWATQNQDPACFIFGSTIRIDGLVRVTGDRPLVLAALDAIDVTMPLDVASHFMGFTMAQSSGPAAPSKACQPPSEAEGSGGGGGGGAGGTFFGEGGPGGDGMAAGGKQAPVASPAQPPTLRAGCSGGNGGKGVGDAGVGGVGGGAIYLVARNKISITSFINASGAAGRPGMPFSGGSGGGSGGMIMLHATMIEGSGAVFANGGGGGGGSANNTGTPGTETSPNNPTAPAAGGGGPGGAGGAGAAVNAPARPGEAQLDRGGGGGGGGEGYIRMNQAPTGLIISPAVDIVQ